MKVAENISREIKLRKTKKIPVGKSFDFLQLLRFFRSQESLILLNSNKDQQLQKDQYGCYDILLAIGSIAKTDSKKNAFDELKKLHEKSDWIFGYFGYDIKNQVEKLSSTNYDGIELEDSHFFIPRYVCVLEKEYLIVHYHPDHDDEQSVEKILSGIKNLNGFVNTTSSTNIRQRISREEYIENFGQIRKHIMRGDIYEMNFCMEFFSENSVIDTISIYKALNERSPMPFSAFMRLNDHYLMCASPERFLAKRGKKIISQPIKGTIRRGKDEGEDKLMIEKLRNDPKEQSENVMIVDLVRNDLSRTAKKGSVVVEELFGIKSFQRLHQMESTVVSELKDGIHFVDAIRSAFPMGSMTGAPKIRAMELIEEFESTKRGLYSGALGYITPEGDFDFNVVIRSILYNNKNGYLSFMVGSAITANADAEREYEECHLKAEAMMSIFVG